MENAVIYARYSSHSQNEQSIETQVEICKSYAKKNNLNIIKIYEDKAKSGTNDNREAFQEMLSDSNKKNFKYVLVYNLSRFARNSTESVMNELILSKNGASVVSATENINGDDSDPIASLIKNIMRGVNEYYSKNTAKNIRDGLKTNAKKGLSIGGFSLPLGYKSNSNKEIIIDEEKAPFVREIFKMYLNNYSMADIVRYLNMNDVKTSRGNEFNKSSILRIVTNKKYIGVYTFKGEEMPVKIPSIIDEKTFEEVQELVKRKHISHSVRSDYLLTDKLYCGLCGAKMTGNLSKHIYHYYKCVNSKGASKTCSKKKVDRDYIEDLVIKEARGLLTTKNIKIIADKVMEYIEQEKDTSTIKALKKSIKNCKQELDNIMDTLKQTTAESVRNLFITEIEKIQTRQRDLENQLIFEEANNMPITATEIRFYLTELKKGRINDIKYRRLLIDTFIHKIYLYDDKMIITFTTNNNKNVDFPSSDEMLSTFEGAIAPPFDYKTNKLVCFDIYFYIRRDNMPSARIHEAIAKNINKQYNMDELLLRLGTVSPDSWRNVPKDSGVKDKYLSHFWDFRVKSGQANDYTEFYFKYYDNLKNPFYFGYLVHLIVDQYWKTYIDPRYTKKENGIDMVKIKDGTYIKDENWFSYFEGLKMQKQIAKIYNLGSFPINQEEIENFECNIDELNLNGLFGEDGTLSYINSDIMPSDEDEESVVYDNASIIKAIDETTEYVFRELERLKQIKRDYDDKIKIAVDIDDTILCTKELEEKYWAIFLHNHPKIDPNKEYKWGDPELALFWKEHREDMAFGDVKENVSSAFKELLNKGYIVDLLSARPLEKYASLKKKLIEHFEKLNVEFSHINLGFYSKIEFLKDHKYDILIDNELRHIEQANEEGILTILFGPYNEQYNGLQTDNWSEIPSLIEKALGNRKSL